MANKVPVKDKELVPVTPRGEATRRKILDAAEAEFGERGFHNASVSSITQRADVGQGTFYLYFHSKEEIFSTLVREIGRALRRAMSQQMGVAKNRMEAERIAMQGFFTFAQEHPGLYRIVQEAQFVDEPAFRDYYQRLAKGYIEALTSAEDRGEVSPGDAEVRAWAIMGIGHMLGMRFCLWQGEVPNAAKQAAMMDFIAHGMAPKK